MFLEPLTPLCELYAALVTVPHYAAGADISAGTGMHYAETMSAAVPLFLAAGFTASVQDIGKPSIFLKA